MDPSPVEAKIECREIEVTHRDAHVDPLEVGHLEREVTVFSQGLFEAFVVA